MNKDLEVQAVYQLPRVKSFIDMKSRKSIKTGGTYLSALVKLNQYVKSKYGSDSDTIIDYLTKKPKEVYELLDGYIGYLPSVKEGITANTISNYIAALRSYFAKYDIDVVSAKFKHKVSLPKKINEKEQPIDASDIRKILLSCNNRRLKAYLLFLMSSGIRADTEACSIRNMDLDFSSSPTKVHLRGEYTKTKTSRDSYISDEATKFLKEFIKFRGETAPEQLLFTSYQNKIPKTVKDTKRVANNLYVRLNIDFMNLLKLVGMDSRKESGLVNKKRHCITLHSFRRFTYTVINEQVNTRYAEFILGHSSSGYHTEKENRIREIYKARCMPALTVLDYTALENTGKNIESRLEQKDIQIFELNKQVAELQRLQAAVRALEMKIK
jgi:site-specific recombinase XerC